MKNKKIKLAIIALVALIIVVLIVLIYFNLFASRNNSRNKNIDNYKLTNNEINSVKDKINELESVDSVDIHTNNNSKIIKIVVNLTEDVEFDEIKKLANESLSGFSEDNLSYYDFEFFVDSNKEESEIYPKIGYKFVSNLEFSW